MPQLGSLIVACVGCCDPVASSLLVLCRPIRTDLGPDGKGSEPLATRRWGSASSLVACASLIASPEAAAPGGPSGSDLGIDLRSDAWRARARAPLAHVWSSLPRPAVRRRCKFAFRLFKIVADCGRTLQRAALSAEEAVAWEKLIRAPHAGESSRSTARGWGGLHT